jgi:hypothetical protein
MNESNAVAAPLSQRVDFDAKLDSNFDPAHPYKEHDPAHPLISDRLEDEIKRGKVVEL